MINLMKRLTALLVVQNCSDLKIKGNVYNLKINPSLPHRQLWEWWWRNALPKSFFFNFCFAVGQGGDSVSKSHQSCFAVWDKFKGQSVLLQAMIVFVIEDDDHFGQSCPSSKDPLENFCQILELQKIEGTPWWWQSLQCRPNGAFEVNWVNWLEAHTRRYVVNLSGQTWRRVGLNDQVNGSIRMLNLPSAKSPKSLKTRIRELYCVHNVRRACRGDWKIRTFVDFVLMKFVVYHFMNPIHQ